jgi:N utilization substance protein B
MSSRRRAREIALQILCSVDRQPELSTAQAVRTYFAHLHGGESEEAADHDTPDGRSAAIEARASSQAGEPGQAEVRGFSEQLVDGVREHQAELDALIGRSSRNWRLERMAWVDRNLLRLASYELLYCPATPARVAINEAIEVAKRYCAGESAAFINGVLDRVLTEIGRRDDRGRQPND